MSDRRAFLAREPSARIAQYRVDPVELGDPLPQLLVLGGHVGRRPVMTFTGIGLGLTDPVPQRLVMHPQPI
ncbi:hypothetical protein [Nocardia exalbida]|uniref:hypothetical protein n=1 Tax=Nocardia exalbida TaxID=290231 RepID=UPI0005924AA1|nr:hypothetical protein [Nocardia exalbida]